jgi:hypothetical protein
VPVVKTVQIERKQNLTPEDFIRDHLQGVGQPVIITDAIQGWPAFAKWTFDYFKESYGSDLAMATPGLHSGLWKLTKLGPYIDYLDTATKELPGFWIDRKTRKPSAPQPYDSPFYLMGWTAFDHAELYNDIQPAPRCISDWTLSLTPTLRDVLQLTCKRTYWAVYIGPEGSLSKLHIDFAHTHGYLAQIQGGKRALLFSPSDSPNLYDGQVDPESPDLERFPLYNQATAYECVIERGDLLFIPSDWWHYVRGLERSITVSHNFFNDANFSQHLTELLRRLPTLVRAFDQIPGLRDALEVQWHMTDVADSSTSPSAGSARSAHNNASEPKGSAADPPERQRA